MSKLYFYAGVAASIVLIAFGAGSQYMGIDGRDQVRGDLAREQIVGTEDSTIPGQKVDLVLTVQVLRPAREGETAPRASALPTTG